MGQRVLCDGHNVPQLSPLQEAGASSRREGVAEVTLKEAIAVIHEGYGDDCPAGGSEYLEARLLLIEAGLMDESAVSESERSDSWPRPEPSAFARLLWGAYVPALKMDMNQSILWTADLGKGLPRVEPPDNPKGR